ncbi:MAG: Na+/H+ antiporter NhaA [Desulfomonile tiedjei]|nr:Na+/H+ antiporter NhaA [Desulfomonile tiedjei]
MKEPKFLHRPLFRTGASIGELLIRPVHTFVSRQASGGLLILIMTVLALGWANSSWGDAYQRFWHILFSAGIRDHVLDKPLHFWINEGLMTIFFFVVGLEIKREILIGELASFRKAALPVAAAAGGMLVPAVIYYALNPSGLAARGWAIPTATDIAFTVSVLTILGSRVPRSLTVFLVALAIVDDLGAVLVIALFYTPQISLLHLEITAALLLILATVNVLGYRRPLLYMLLGCLVWAAVYLSGVHSTVAGILVAFTIPARSKFDTDVFLGGARGLLDRFECAGPCGYSMYTNADHQDAVRELEALCVAVEPPLLRIEHALSPVVVFVVVPIFAFANAGVPIDVESLAQVLGSSSTMGVFLGLVVGKQLGVFSASWVAIRIGIAEMPAAASWIQIYGCAVLCGIGFTMSIFIADLAFAQTPFIDPAKIGILSASSVSLVLGLLVLYLGARK